MIVRASLTALVARAGITGLRAKAPDHWQRKNHAGRTVGLHAGPASAVAAAAGAALVRPGLGAAVLAAGACGAYDDVVGAHDPRRGFRAHMSALRHGEVTSGAVKLFGVGAAGLLAGALLKERAVDKVLAGVVIAGTAHVVNLVDVRPGRAVGVVLALGAPGLLRGGVARELSAAAMGAAAAVLPDDVAERSMIGDTGAHALGAALGAAVVAGNGRAGLVAHAAALVAATVYGDKVSEAARNPGLAHIRAAAHPCG
ncbi:hypothetical protein [Streptomyces sp. P17]|uniref:hypothetical protein n=1 Tax=Streptomyces sp. P17 TaxID=3074716 RepID=UPI0028F41732|nr:hypothetical protein [Streptomyces sp. P17]MDT9696138.1 hypothetical protein [Streptomyces sp. P17]